VSIQSMRNQFVMVELVYCPICVCFSTCCENNQFIIFR